MKTRAGSLTNEWNELAAPVNLFPIHSIAPPLTYKSSFPIPLVQDLAILFQFTLLTTPPPPTARRHLFLATSIIFIFSQNALSSFYLFIPGSFPIPFPACFSYHHLVPSSFASRPSTRFLRTSLPAPQCSPSTPTPYGR